MTGITNPSTLLMLCIAGLLLWGLWANTWKLAGKWRFELYVIDFGFGLALTSLIICFTAGFSGSDITFLDNITIIRTRQVGLPLLAGGLTALGMLLTMGAISLSGLSTGFAVSMGTGILSGAIWRYFLFPKTNSVFLFGGSAIVAGGAALAALAFSLYQHKRNEGLPLPPSAVSRRPAVRKHSAGRAIALALLGGAFLGTFHPLLTLTQTFEVEMGAYAILFLFACGVVPACLLFNMYFFNLPVEGKNLSFGDYFRSSAKQHAMGLLGGALWALALAANLVAITAPAGLAPVALSSGAAVYGAALLSVLAGLTAWREWKDAPDRARIFIWLSVPISLTGVLLVSLASAYVQP